MPTTSPENVLVMRTRPSAAPGPSFRVPESVKSVHMEDAERWTRLPRQGETPEALGVADAGRQLLGAVELAGVAQEGVDLGVEAGADVDPHVGLQRARQQDDAHRVRRPGGR